MTWDARKLVPRLSRARFLQGKLLGYMQGLGFDLQSDTMLGTLTREVLTSWEIEGEKMDLRQVRSSIARRLGMQVSGMVSSPRNVEDAAAFMVDVTQHFDQPVTRERLLAWHLTLFPEGRSGAYTILSGCFRDDSTGPMQVVSGPLGREIVHFQAPAAQQVSQEMDVFLAWLDTSDNLEPALKSGLAHLWFLTIHPFEDGNGRIARALSELLLARSDGSSRRFYAMSGSIRRHRKSYYTILERTQRGGLDVTVWIEWYLDRLLESLEESHHTLEEVLRTARFWQQAATIPMNLRQQKVVNRMLSGFKGNMTSSRWGRMAGCSQDTALRDIQDLVNKGLLERSDSGGRSTAYRVNLPLAF